MHFFGAKTTLNDHILVEFKVPSLSKKNHCELFIKSTNKFLLNDAANTIRFILDAETIDSD